MELKDHPTFRPNTGTDVRLASERGASLKEASAALPDFARWYEKESGWYGRMSAEMAAVLFCESVYINHPRSNRWAFQQILGQLYEQQVLGEMNLFPETLLPDDTTRTFFFNSPAKANKASRAPALVGV